MTGFDDAALLVLRRALTPSAQFRDGQLSRACPNDDIILLVALKQFRTGWEVQTAPCDGQECLFVAGHAVAALRGRPVILRVQL